MGLDTSHGCWHGAYSAFHRFRTAVAKAAGIDLDLMEGFEWLGTMRKPSPSVQMSWDLLKPRPVYELLMHSDCDGEIEARMCGPIADDLQTLLDTGNLEDWRRETERFISGLHEAARNDEPVTFG